MALLLIIGSHIHGNTASPNPTYPQNIEVVTGTQNVKVENVNLLPNNVTTQVLNGVTITINEDKSITLNGTATAPTNFFLFDNGTNILKSGTYTLALLGREKDKTGIYISSSASTRIAQIGATNETSVQRLTFTLNEDTTLFRAWIYFNTGTQLNNLRIYPMIYKGDSTTTSYTPHQEQTQTIGLSSKNLFGDTLRQGVTNYETGSYSSNNAKRITTTNWITLPKGTYTISAKTNQNITLAISNVTFDINGNFYDISGVSGQWKNLPYTITLPQDTKWKCNLSYSIGQDIFPSEISEMQIEVGSQKTTYEEYYNYELCKIGTYQDYLYKSNDKWYKKEQISKVVLNGTQGTWAKGGASGTTYSVFQANGWDLIKYIGNTTQIFCDKLSGGDTITSPLSGEYMQTGQAPNSPIRISILNSRLTATTSEAFNTFLTNNNLICYIPLQVANDIQITNTTLIEQLDNLEKLKSYNGITNINCSGNLSAILSVSALKGE